tara:strand:- start:780 stop:905 length:126 start_codon:yes stop_codon:yes gene_type:complete
MLENFKANIERFKDDNFSLFLGVVAGTAAFIGSFASSLFFS